MCFLYRQAPGVLLLLAHLLLSTSLEPVGKDTALPLSASLKLAQVESANVLQVRVDCSAVLHCFVESLGKSCQGRFAAEPLQKSYFWEAQVVHGVVFVLLAEWEREPEYWNHQARRTLQAALTLPLRAHRAKNILLFIGDGELPIPIQCNIVPLLSVNAFIRSILYKIYKHS